MPTVEEMLREEIKNIAYKVDKVDRNLQNVVSKQVCETTRSAINSKIAASHSEVLAAINLLKSEINGKVERKVVETTGSFHKPSALERMASVAKSIYTIIVLLAMLIGGCVASSYYISGAMNLLKQAAAQTSQATQELQEQRQLLQKQLKKQKSDSSDPFYD